jgi:hypothetical protein
MRREWRTIHRAFGGIGLFSIAVEHTTAMIIIFIQHYGAGTTLARKFLASIEALQLEIGCVGNPLEEDYDHFHVLATPCWMKSFWECLHFYHFQIYADYPCLHLPRHNDNLLITIFWLAGYRDGHLHFFNLCSLAHNLLFLSDMPTVDGQMINLAFLLPLKHPRRHQSIYVFPTKRPERVDWRRWMEFEHHLRVMADSSTAPWGNGSTCCTGYGSGSTGHAQTQCIESAVTKQQYTSIHLLQEYGHARSTSMPATLTSSLRVVCQQRSRPSRGHNQQKGVRPALG